MVQAVAGKLSDSVEDAGGRKPKSAGSLLALVWAQFFGSDLESGYNFLYTWLANQFGHFMIGFAGGFACVWIFSIWHPSALQPQALEDVSLVAKILTGWFLLWMLKETLFDVFGAYGRLNRTKERLASNSNGTGPTTERVDKTERNFKSNLLTDSFVMDAWFYLAGVITAFTAIAGQTLTVHWKTESWVPMISWGSDCTESGVVCLGGILPLLTFVICLIASYFISATWLRRNIAFDRAQLPFVRRFALTDRPVEPRAREEAVRFALTRTPTKSNHLLIIGPPKSGRTGIAVALGAEALLAGEPPANIVRYITLCKMLDQVVSKQRGVKEPEEDTLAFPPAEADLLIIDDVGAETPATKKVVDSKKLSSEPLISATQLRDVLNRVLENREGLAATVAGKRIIWVVGDKPDDQTVKNWREAIESVFGQGCTSPPIVLRGAIANPERAGQHAKEATYGFGPTSYSGIVWKSVCVAATLICFWFLWDIAEALIA